jgi:hypothetical protein
MANRLPRKSATSYDPTSILPPFRCGTRSAAQEAVHQAALGRLAAWLLSHSSGGTIRYSKRGLGYLAEGEGRVAKGEFAKIDYWIDLLRKRGDVPVHIVGDDEKRSAENLPHFIESPAQFAARRAASAADCWEYYDPGTYWRHQKHYVELAVEKSDLKTLFADVFEEFQVPYFNTGGWWDINTQHDLLVRMKAHHLSGRKCVLIRWADFDPGGLLIVDRTRNNLLELARLTGFEATEANLKIVHAGLTEAQIHRLRLPWIEGLKTSSGEDLASPRHPDHRQEYVQSWLRRHGARKIEANALLADPDAARELCRRAIRRYIDPAGVAAYWEEVERGQEAVRAALPDALRRALGRR